MTRSLRRVSNVARRLLGRGGTRLREERTARALLRVFSALIHKEGAVQREELEVAFDFVRNFFPGMDHTLLGQFLEEAVSRPVPLPSPLAQLKTSLTQEQKTMLALQLIAFTSEDQHPLFLEIMEGLDAAGPGQEALQEFENPNQPAPASLPRLDFGNKPGAIALPNDSEQAFRCYRIGGMILVRNLSHDDLQVRGYPLGQDRILQLRPNDEVIVDSWRLSHVDFVSFFQVVQSSDPSPIFLTVEDGVLHLNRSKSKNSLARLIFGIEVEICALRDEALTIVGRPPMREDMRLRRPYHDEIRITGSDTVKLDALRRASLQSGQRFRLPGGRRRVIVSNDPGSLSGDDNLLLTPGLAAHFILQIDFDPTTGKGELEVLQSAQDIQIDGQTVKQASLRDGTLIRMGGRQALRCRFNDNFLDEERNLVRELRVEGVNYSFWKGGRTVDQLSFQVNQGQMLCIIGPSGSGKSTLLEILAGQRRPDQGKVTLNGLSLYERRQRLTPLISFMPQEEALMGQLSAREHLAHACAIRRPHLRRRTIDRRVNHIIDELGLERVADRRVGSAGSKSLSGGERSRLNAGLDLIGGGEIFLFDEPISGLSSKDAEYVVDSLRGLARDKIVITSLHRPSSKVLRAFDLVLLLDRGGRMAYYGPPSGLVEYFESARQEFDIPGPAQQAESGADFVFDILETPELAVGGRSGGRVQRRFPPEFWQERYENRQVLDHLTDPLQAQLTGSTDLPTAEDELPAPEPPTQGRRQRWQIFRTHLSRSLKSKFRYPGTFYSILLEAPLLALLISMTLRASAEGGYDFATALHLPSYLFLAMTVAMFFGLTNSATEILRDRAVLRRERNCQPHPVLYFTAKFFVLATLIILQSATFIAVAHWILEIAHMHWPHLLWMTLTGCCGTAIALFVSALARSERTALGAIPLILVPQILLAGALIPFSEMNRGLFRDGATGRERGTEPVPSTVMPLRYAYEGLLITQATQNAFEKARRPIQRQVDRLTENDTTASDTSLAQAKDSLTVLFAASAENARESQQILQDPLAARERLLTLPTSAEEDRRPVVDFHVNKRVENLVALAEASRLDDRRESKTHVFLAEKKFLLLRELSTTWYCGVTLVLMTTFFLALAAFLLHRSLTRA